MPAKSTKSTSSKSRSSTPKLMSDAAVVRATGKTWKQWLAILDKAGARGMNHQQIVACVVKQHNVVPWWRQMVAVTYEQQRGLRKPHERPDGFSISRSKTVPVPVARLYRAWTEPTTRARWLRDSKFSVRKATLNKSIRITWIDGATNIETNFYSKGASKSQVTVQHNKLATAKDGERMKRYWTAQLDRMAGMLDS